MRTNTNAFFFYNTTSIEFGSAWRQPLSGVWWQATSMQTTCLFWMRSKWIGRTDRDLDFRRLERVSNACAYLFIYCVSFVLRIGAAQCVSINNECVSLFLLLLLKNDVASYNQPLHIVFTMFLLQNYSEKKYMNRTLNFHV